MELSIAYTFTVIDVATSATLGSFTTGNSDGAKAASDWIGYLDPQQGITGLLDGPSVRSSVADLAQGDGAVVGPAFAGQRAGTIQGILNPNATTATREAAQARIKKALWHARFIDASLKWFPSSGASVQRRLRVRSAGPPIFTGRQPTTFLIPLVSPDAVILDDTAATSTINLPTGGALTTVTPTIAGDVPTWPWFELTGPLTSFSVINGLTGDTISGTHNLLVGRKLLIFPERAITLEEIAGVRTNKDSAITRSATRWWRLKPGASQIQASASGAVSGQTTVKASWFPAWP